MRIGKIASSAGYRMDKQFQNLPIFVWVSKFGTTEYRTINISKFQNYEY